MQLAQEAVIAGTMARGLGILSEMRKQRKAGSTCRVATRSRKHERQLWAVLAMANGGKARFKYIHAYRNIWDYGPKADICPLIVDTYSFSEHGRGGMRVEEPGWANEIRA